MQTVVVEDPYEFISPHRGRWSPWLVTRLLGGRYVKKNYQVRGCEVRGAEKMRASLDAGHGIVVTSNHPRPCDPMAASWITHAVKHPFYCMASRHTFFGSAIQIFLMRRCGAFSINREGSDHASLSFCVEAIATADRPIIIFAEGLVTRHNDQIAPLLDGSALIARMAAKRRAKLKPPGKVVLHGVVFKYFFRGDLNKTLPPVLNKVESELGLAQDASLSFQQRAERAFAGLIARRETEFLGEARSGDPDERIRYLLDQILDPLEAEWADDEPLLRSDYQRVQRLRTRILPDMVAKKVTEEERQRRWKQLADCYYAQQLGCYPPGYQVGDGSPERLLELVESVEEDLFDVATPQGPLDLVIQIGDAIEVPAKRERNQDGDPVMAELGEQMAANLVDVINNPPEPTRGLRVV